MATNVKAAMKLWEEKHPDENIVEAGRVKLCCLMPPINKMDPGALNTLTNCEWLSLSTNAIDKMTRLELPNLKILSLARNRIKKIDGLQAVAGTLEQLWLSYNECRDVDGVLCCRRLKTLYLAHNKIKDWSEIEKLRQLDALEDILLVGNPVYSEEGIADVSAARIRVIQCIPHIQKIDGILVTPLEQEAAASAGAGVE
jgi:dynein light chain 1